jgi:serine/threonine protein kinase/WD40 repeat protein
VSAHKFSDPARRLRLSELLDAALELPSDQRESWLSEQATRDPEMASALESLLSAQAKVNAQGFLEDAIPMAASTPAGQRLGAYTLVQLLGEGGMGSVWLGKRSDGRFEGEVAIKLLHPGLLRASDLERFRREGNLLARLSHPNIARLVDAGITEHRQPYLVLEYVQGQPIDAACDAAGYGVKARVRLFIQVLDAVAHAHARLVVHRDIKPGNVLVGTDGWVKLLDFGIAKLVDADQSGTSDLTRESGRAFTPQFAAPEQLAGEPVTTATDVYALGVLLYSMLAGRNPLASDTPRKNGSISLPLASVTAATVKTLQWARELTGDLDNILAKALRPDPTERFATADAFAEDLRRYLRGDAVGARPDTFAYRARCFVRRHKGAVAGSIVGLLSVLAFATVAVWQASEARTQSANAERQAQIAVARGAAAYAVAQSSIRIDRALLLGAEAVQRHLAPETSVGLLSALDAARHLVGFRRDLGSGLNALAISEDRREAVTIDESGLVRRVSLADGKLLASRNTGASSALGIYYRAQERFLFIAGVAGGEVLDTTTLQPAAGMSRIQSPNRAWQAYVDVTADATLAVAILYNGHTVVITDAHTGAVTRSFSPVECTQTNGVTLIPTRHEFVLGCANGVQFYDSVTGRHLRGQAGPLIGYVELSRDGRLATLVGQDNQTNVVETATLKPVLTNVVVPGGRVYAARFNRNGHQLALGTDSGWVAVWDLDHKREIARFGGLEDGITAVEWLADDFGYTPDRGVEGLARLIVTTVSSVTEWDLTQTASIGKAVRSLDLPSVSYPEDPIDAERGLAYRKFVREPRAGSRIGISTVSLIDGKELRSFALDVVDLSSLTVSPDGAKLFATALVKSSAASGPALQLLVLAAASGAIVSRLELPDGFVDAASPVGNAPSIPARFSADGTRLAGVSNGKAVIWSLSSGRTIATAAIHPLTKVFAWSPDDRYLVTTREQGTVLIFDTQGLQQRNTFERQIGYTIKQMFASAALGGIVVTSEWGEAYVLDAATARIVGEPFRSGGSQLQRSAVSPDARYLAAWSSDGAVRIWEVASRVAMGPPLRGHPPGRQYNRIWFNHEGTLSTYTPGLKIDWNLDVLQAARFACRRVGRTLTRLEWQQFVGELDYSPACNPS